MDYRIEGKIRVCVPLDPPYWSEGFDEFMNLVIDDAVEVNLKKDKRRQLGRILLKGENVTLIAQAEV
jgi:LSM domain